MAHEHTNDLGIITPDGVKSQGGGKALASIGTGQADDTDQQALASSAAKAHGAQPAELVA